jgi:uncharacterized tellurite resistance protein B-like protein
MFTDLLNRLTGAAPQPDPLADYRRALAALLVRCARVDGVYDADEQAMIERVLRNRYALAPDAAADLRAQGETLEGEAGDTVHLTRAVKEGVPYDERFAVAQALWSVALADNERDHLEDSFMRLTVKLLGISDVDSARARQRAAGEAE